MVNPDHAEHSDIHKLMFGETGVRDPRAGGGGPHGAYLGSVIKDISSKSTQRAQYVEHTGDMGLPVGRADHLRKTCRRTDYDGWSGTE